MIGADGGAYRLVPNSVDGRELTGEAYDGGKVTTTPSEDVGTTDNKQYADKKHYLQHNEQNNQHCFFLPDIFKTLSFYWVCYYKMIFGVLWFLLSL